MAARITAAPYLRPALPDDELDRLCADYTRLTGARVTDKVRGLLASCARRHGPDTTPLLAELWESRHTTTNLLLDLRDHALRAPSAPAHGTTLPAAPPNTVAEAARWSRGQPPEAARTGPIAPLPEPSTDIDDLLETVAWVGGSPPVYKPRLDDDGRVLGLTYGLPDRPPFDSASQRRHDRRPSADKWNRDHGLCTPGELLDALGPPL